MLLFALIKIREAKDMITVQSRAFHLSMGFEDIPGDDGATSLTW